MTSFRSLVAGMVVILALLQVETAWAKYIYRWLDRNGETQVSTVLPPGVAELGYEILQNGIVINRVKPAKTKAEREQDRIRELLRAESEGVLADAEKEDALIDRTYSSVEEVIKAESNRISELNSNLLNNLKRIQQKEGVLLKKQEKAAAAERAGNRVPSRLRKEIEGLLTSISEAERLNRSLEQKKVVTRKYYASMKAKVRQRIALGQAREEYLGSADSNAGSAINVVMMLDAVECKTLKACANAWVLAKEYLQDNSTTPIVRDKSRVIKTAKPVNSRDISLMLTRLPRKGEASLLFLDVICKDDKRGQRLCNSERIKGIRQNFRSYVAGE